MSTPASGLQAQWEPDCQGKEDFDCQLVHLSSRLYPRGGGYSVLKDSHLASLDARDMMLA